jgi:hypothetical protein
LQETLRIAPDSDKAALLAAKAALNIGQVSAADKALQVTTVANLRMAKTPIS